MYNTHLVLTFCINLRAGSISEKTISKRLVKAPGGIKRRGAAAGGGSEEITHYRCCCCRCCCCFYCWCCCCCCKWRKRKNKSKKPETPRARGEALPRAEEAKNNIKSRKVNDPGGGERRCCERRRARSLLLALLFLCRMFREETDVP